MRILVMTQYYWPEVGAAQARLQAFCARLTRTGWDVNVLTAMPNYPAGKVYPSHAGKLWFVELESGVRIHRVWHFCASGAGFRRLVSYLSFTAACVLALFRIRRPEVIFVESPPLFIGLAGVAAKWAFRAPLVLNVSDLWPDSVEELGIVHNRFFLDLARRLERFLYKQADFVTAVTDGLYERLAHKHAVPLEKLLFLPNGVDTQVYRPMAKDAQLCKNLGLEGRRVFIYAGTHGYAHRLDTLINAAALLQDTPAHFLLIGDGSEKRRLVDRVASGRISNVTFLDPVPADQLPRYYSLAEASVSTLAKGDLFLATRPAKVIASMACGTAVIYSGSGEGAELVTKARAGVVLEPEQPELIRDAVVRSLAEPDRLAAEGRNGREYVVHNLDWCRIIDEWVATFTARIGATRN